MLRPIAQDLWVTERSQRFLGIEMGTRMTVVRLADGGLFVHSPVRLDEATRRDLDGLGPVRAVVAPNRYHHLHVSTYFAAYPDARVFAAPGLPEKRCDLPFHEVLSDEAPPLWAGQLHQFVFRALPVLNEVIFWHASTRTLITTDLVSNIRHAEGLPARIFFWLDGTLGRFNTSRMWRPLVRDRAAARVAINRLLMWDFDRVVLAHGDILETGGREAMRRSFVWLSVVINASSVHPPCACDCWLARA
jgi:hypothetical protein